MTDKTLLVLDSEKNLWRIELCVDENKIPVYDYTAENIFGRVCEAMEEAVQAWLAGMVDADLDTFMGEGFDDFRNLFSLPDLVHGSAYRGYPGLLEALRVQGLHSVTADMVGSEELHEEESEDYLGIWLSDIITDIKEEREEEEVELP